MDKKTLLALPVVLAALAACNSEPAPASTGGGDGGEQTVTPTPNPLLPGARLNDTGVIDCANVHLPSSADGPGTGPNVSLDCQQVLDKAGNAIPEGQDADSGRDQNPANLQEDGVYGFQFTKLAGANGQPLAATAEQYSCVQDRVTGLVWEAKGNDTNALDRHFRGFTFSWYDPTPNESGAGVNAGRQDLGSCAKDPQTDLASCDTQALIDAMNQAQVCGLTDWRLPTVNELVGLVDYGRNASSAAGPRPAIDNTFFPHTNMQRYWTSTPVIARDGTPIGYSSFVGLTVDFGTGEVVEANRSGSDADADKLYVRLVSDGHQ